MSDRYEREAEDRYEAENDISPVSGNADSKPYDDPMQPPQSNSDQQLESDEREAVDKSNILSGSRLRYSKPQSANRYNEGLDENDLPSQTYYKGQSSTR
ncbi:hypothetical protein UA08_09164 [Talaromyces atroroseus]|uniref:Uncharacterized protein n=1 Tax=Talaromyces atroroseus TaxID=1441469 RepID=A0A1Q5Q788_TALAT|nr:hypothetical protein UA08_09164 [Talaromyces atroroseus]OKL55551.1 hypothetical protein UA08_09164 [Talaromyces atroroseus]